MKHLILLCALLISFNSFADELVDVNKKKPVVTDGGWKSIANWEQLAIGIKPSAVRKILGEPQKIDGGILVIWHYKRGGRVVFQVGKVFSWNKPDQQLILARYQADKPKLPALIASNKEQY